MADAATEAPPIEMEQVEVPKTDEEVGVDAAETLTVSKNDVIDMQDGPSEGSTAINGAATDVKEGEVKTEGGSGDVAAVKEAGGDTNDATVADAARANALEKIEILMAKAHHNEYNAQMLNNIKQELSKKTTNLKTLLLVENNLTKAVACAEDSEKAKVAAQAEKEKADEIYKDVSREYRGKDKKTGNKSDLESQKVSRNIFEIKKQVGKVFRSCLNELIDFKVEFYFSDSNLVTDKFLFEKTGGHKNIPVPIDIIHSFKRMRHFQPREAVVEGLKESMLLEVVDNDTAVRRKIPLIKGDTQSDVLKALEDDIVARSLYVKGFGPETPLTQFDIEAFFSTYGTFNQVRLRRHNDKTFKGSIFVEFESIKIAGDFMNHCPQPTYNGNPLIIKTKGDYLRENAERMSNQSRQVDPRSRHGRRGPSDDRDWRVRRDLDRALDLLSHNRHGGSHRGRGNSRGTGRRSDLFRRGDRRAGRKRVREEDEETLVDSDNRAAKKVETETDEGNVQENGDNHVTKEMENREGNVDNPATEEAKTGEESTALESEPGPVPALIN